MNERLLDLKQKLENVGHEAHVFDSSAQALDFLAERLSGKTVAFGGSVTLDQIGLYERIKPLASEILWHWKEPEKSAEIFKRALSVQAYVLSANAVARTGEIVNMDGNGNRVAASIFGPEEVYFVIGRNKLTDDLASAIDRVQNIAAPLNAKRLHKATPCAKDGKCHNCRRSDCFCCVMTIHKRRPSGINSVVVLIDEDLGY